MSTSSGPISGKGTSRISMPGPAVTFISAFIVLGRAAVGPKLGAGNGATTAMMRTTPSSPRLREGKQLMLARLFHPVRSVFFGQSPASEAGRSPHTNLPFDRAESGEAVPPPGRAHVSADPAGVDPAAIGETSRSRLEAQSAT